MSQNRLPIKGLCFANDVSVKLVADFIKDKKEKGRAGREGARPDHGDTAGRRSAVFRHRAQLGGGERTR